MSPNRLIENAPIYIPILVAAALVLVTWYRPGGQTPETTFHVPEIADRTPDARGGKP